MPASRIRAEVQVPSFVMVPRGRQKVRLDVVALIHNDSQDHYVMGVSDPSAVHTWQILDDASREVARHEVGVAKKVRGVTSAYCSTLVPSGLSLREHETLVVDGSKLRDGRVYTVRHTHWGYTDEAQFVAVVEPERVAPAKKAKRASGVKKAKKAKRKAASRKSGGKTARRR
jgi:hypothetical protein